MGRILLLLLVITGCRQLFGIEPPVAVTADAPETCSSTEACSVGVCKLPDGICVDCIVDADCPAEMPVCNTANSCERCDAHDDCPSNACNISSGACIAESDVAYVAPGGGDAVLGECPRAEPCGDLTTAVNTDKPFIKFDAAGTVDVTTVQTIDHDVTILAERGARLRRVITLGPIISIPSDASVSIQDLEIGEGSGSTGHGITVTAANAILALDRVSLIDNGGRGLDVTMGQKIVMRRCIVSGNNEGGASLTDVDFEITNSLFVRNDGSTVGGLRITAQGMASFFHFNTVASNNATDPTQSGINCDTVFTANNNIVTDNGLDPTCRFDFSLFNGVLPTMGTGNKSGDPSFVDTDPAKAREKTYFRIKSSSNAIDSADPAATLADDIDGQSRPQGTIRDIGADEFVP